MKSTQPESVTALTANMDGFIREIHKLLGEGKSQPEVKAYVDGMLASEVAKAIRKAANKSNKKFIATASRELSHYRMQIIMHLLSVLSASGIIDVNDEKLDCQGLKDYGVPIKAFQRLIRDDDHRPGILEVVET